jgi:hypothetical protein
MKNLTLLDGITQHRKNIDVDQVLFESIGQLELWITNNTQERTLQEKAWG